MNCSITTSPAFDKAFKALAKRYLSLRTDLISFVEEIRENPTIGTQLGHNLRKARFKISSKGRGKSGDARVITHTILYSTDGADVTLLTIYDKSNQSSISDNELKKLLKDNNLE